MKERIYLSNDLAFRLWRMQRSPRRTFAVSTKAAFVPVRPKRHVRNQLANYLENFGLQPPHDIAVANDGDRWTADPQFTCHIVAPPVGRASFFRVVGSDADSLPFELYIASPELSYLQMARKLTLIQTIGYGYELCGSYTPDESGKDEPEQLTALSSPKKLLSYCDRAKGMHGSRQGLRAAKFVLAGSGSIRETELSMMLSLPRRLGGFNVLPPELNHLVETSGTRETFVSQNRFFIDLCWPEQRVGIEVQSSKHHSGWNKLVKDARRKNSLQFYGYTIIEATQGDLSSALGIAGLARQACAAMGIRPERNQFDVDLDRLALYDEVFGLSKYP